MRALIVYWSQGGNTTRAAQAIQTGLQEAGADVTLQRVAEAEDWFAYDLVCVGFPSYQWSPPKPMDDWLKAKWAEYRGQGRIKVGAPRLAGHHALLFCTFSGQHTAEREATPALLYVGQFFEHLGFAVLGAWALPGEYHGSEEASTLGRMGDIRGRPNAADLAKVQCDAFQLAQGLLSSAG